MLTTPSPAPWIQKPNDLRCKAMEEALQHSERRLLTAQEAGGIGIWEWDLRTQESYFTPECERLYDCPPGTLKSNNMWRNCVLPEDLPLIDAHWETTIANLQPFEQEFRIRLPSGEIRWILSKGCAQYDEKNHPILISGINLDISQKKRSQESLRLYERVVAEMIEAVILVGNDRKILFSNPANDALFGYEPGEMLGLDVAVCNAPTDHDPTEIAEQIMSILALEGQWTGEVANIKKMALSFGVEPVFGGLNMTRTERYGYRYFLILRN